MSIALILLLVVSLCTSNVVSSSDIRTIKLMEIDYGKLSRLDDLSTKVASQVLSSVGILKISSIPGLSTSQNDAFSSLSACMKATQDDTGRVFQTFMNDGTKRLTIGAKSISGIAEKMSSDCGKSSTTMRSIIDKTTQQLFRALDYASSMEDIKSFSSSQFNSMKPYATMEDLLTNGEHLEHLHAFYNTKNHTNLNSIMSPGFANASKKDMNLEGATFQMHTDVGLFIAMTTGYYSTSGNNKEQVNTQRGLFVTLPTGEIVHVSESDLTRNDLIIMIGQGGADWLAPKHGVSLRAVPHTLIVDLGNDKEATRSWYGKMYLPPLDAELYNQPGVTFKEFQDKQLKTLQSSNKFMNRAKTDKNDLVSVPVACGKSMHESGVATSAANTENVNIYGDSGHTFHMLAPTSCASTEIMCWMGCRSVSTLSCSAGTVPTCADSAGNAVDPMAMGMYAPKCLAPPPTMAPNSGPVPSVFCVGPGTSMSMTGFESTVTQGSNALCYVYLIPSWVLDTSTKFGFACFGTVLIGIFIHSLSSLKLRIEKWKITTLIKLFLYFVIYFIQILASYIIMLISMSFNVELFFMVVIGLTIGYVMFNPKFHILCFKPNEADKDTVATTGVFTTHVEPCCQSLDDHSHSTI